MRIFITGATGYVGRHLLPVLIKEGHQIYPLVRARAERILKHSSVHPVLGDMTDSNLPSKLAAQTFDAVIHLAFSLFPKSSAAVNEVGMDNMVRAFASRSIQRFVFLSSALVYGPTAPDTEVCEDHECRPNMKFARQQRCAEEMLLEEYRKSGFPVVIIRPSEIFGRSGGYFADVHLKGLRDRAIPILGSGNNKISMTHVDDVVSAICASLSEDRAVGEIFNINIPDTVSSNELADYVSRRTGQKKTVRLPLIAGMLAAAGAMGWAGIVRKTPSLNCDIVKLATMPAGVRCCKKSARVLGVRPRYHSIFDGLDAEYFCDSNLYKQ